MKLKEKKFQIFEQMEENDLERESIKNNFKYVFPSQFPRSKILS